MKRHAANANANANAAGSRTTRRLISTVAAADPRGLAVLTGLQVATAALQAAALLLLLQLLAVAHVSQTGSKSGIASLWRTVFARLHIPNNLTATLIVYVIVISVATVASTYASVRATRFRLEFIDGLRNRLYSAVAGATWEQLLSLRQSDLLSTLTVNVNGIGNGVTSLLSLETSVLLVAAQLVIAVRISLTVTGLAVVTGALLVVVVWPLARLSRRLGLELIDSNRGVVASVTGFLGGLKLSKAHGLEESHVSQFSTALTRARQAQIDFAWASGISNSVQTVIGVVVLALLVDIAVTREHLAVASLLVLLFIFSRLIGQVPGLQRSALQLIQAGPAFDDLMDLLADCQAAAEATPAVTASRRLAIGSGLQLRDVEFGYGDHPAVVRGVSFDIPARHTVALVGPSGAGKTTLADIIVGLLRPTSGDLFIDGKRLQPTQLKAWRASIALVPQEPFLFHRSVRNNLLWAAPHASDDQLWQVLATTSSRDFVEALPMGLDTIVGDRGVRLSGGERQRIALARALLREPSLLVLDEATSSLDTENERAIRHALTDLRGTVTMLVIAHRLSTVSNADVIVVVDGGRVVETGRWHELAGQESGRLRALIDAGAVE